MRHPAIYFPTKDRDISPYLQNIFEKLSGGLDAKYGIALADVTAVQTHKTDIVNAIEKSVQDHETAQASTEDKNNRIHDAKVFVLKILNDIQDHSAFEEQDAEDLGMRVYKEPINYDEVQPEISKIHVLPDKVILDWVKGALDGVIIEGSYNGSDFTEIGKDTHSPFEDKRSNVSEGPETRYYRLRYFKNDEPVGLYSTVVKVVCHIP